MGRYDALINKLYSDEADRKLARAFASHFGDMPGMDDRVSSLLMEAARSAENVGGGAMSPQQAWDYLRDYAAAIGAPPIALAGFDTWFDSTSAEFAATETPAAEPAKPVAETESATQPTPNAGGAAAAGAPAGQPAPPSLTAAPARSAPTLDRAALQAQIDGHLADMRCEIGSEGYRRYWGGGAAKYAEALRMMEALDAAPPPPAGGAPTPAPAQPAPAAEP